MSGEYTVYNLLPPGCTSGYRLVSGYKWPGYPDPGHWIQRTKCTPGKAYTLSCIPEKDGEMCFGFYLSDGSCTRPNGYEWYNAGSKVVRTLTAPENAAYVAASWVDGNTRPMLVEGTTPAAWAPAEGEELAGGGCVHER